MGLGVIALGNFDVSTENLQPFNKEGSYVVSVLIILHSYWNHAKCFICTDEVCEGTIRVKEILRDCLKCYSVEL